MKDFKVKDLVAPEGSGWEKENSVTITRRGIAELMHESFIAGMKYQRSVCFDYPIRREGVVKYPKPDFVDWFNSTHKETF